MKVKKMTNSELKEDIIETENELISLKQFELINLKNLLKYLDDENNKISFSVELPKADAELNKITKFNIKDCMDDEVKTGFKKMLKVGLTRAIKKRETFLTAFNELIL